ncbi:MAG: hypothetical protein LBQ31_10015 [Bacteroidales bacterium]|nr:hypothetical protein [Bacteroidales bacterium]
MGVPPPLAELRGGVGLSLQSFLPTPHAPAAKKDFRLIPNATQLRTTNYGLRIETHTNYIHKQQPQPQNNNTQPRPTPKPTQPLWNINQYFSAI